MHRESHWEMLPAAIWCKKTSCLIDPLVPNASSFNCRVLHLPSLPLRCYQPNRLWRMMREKRWVKFKNRGSSYWTSKTLIISLHAFFRFWSPWTHQEWRCSKTQHYQTTFQRRRRAQTGRLTEQFPAPQLRKMPVEAGSMLLPVSFPKPSTGETGAALFWDLTEVLLKDSSLCTLLEWTTVLWAHHRTTSCSYEYDLNFTKWLIPVGKY